MEYWITNLKARGADASCDIENFVFLLKGSFAVALTEKKQLKDESEFIFQLNTLTGHLPSQLARHFISALTIYYKRNPCFNTKVGIRVLLEYKL